MLIRGGRLFTEVTRVLFLGSIADDGSLQPHIIGIGFRMKFFFGEQFVVTSPVQSLSHDNVSAASRECAAAQ